MTRWLPYPLLSIALLAAWLLLAGSLAPGALIPGLLLALAGGRLAAALRAPRLRLARPLAALSLAGTVLREILRSNLAVAWIVVSRQGSRRRSGFVRIPLRTREPYVLAALAVIVTATPGTLWVEYDSADRTMLLHVLDLKGEAAWLRVIAGYESRLMAIVGEEAAP
jgi:multisubunit Na+/H+ antiporter MnhE subunit